jgi:hypothetical protein
LNPGGTPVFLAYRQRLANLEALRPLPLIRSVQPKAGADFTDEDTNNIKLRSYYATGATCVSSHVGRFHILDRSTHSLLSPSSVANRLHLIEQSRRKASWSDGSVTSSSRHLTDHYAESVSSRHDDDETNASTAHANPSVLSSLLKATTLSAHNDLLSMASNRMMLFNDEVLPQSIDAITFIPVVTTALHDESSDAAFLLQARTAALTPILTACYLRHGGAALLAVEGLVKLLVEHNFFADDMDHSNDNESSARLTLLDLAIQTVCDVATSSCEETTFASCVEFVEMAVRLSHAQLNTRTIGYVVRFYLFVFYFGACVPSNKSWTQRSSGRLYDAKEANLLDDPRDLNVQFLPGGAPQAAALAFKELISLSIGQ